MENHNTPALEQVLKAFTYHQPVSVTKKDGEHIAAAYILIMYGDVAFRMQEATPGLDSHFVSVSDIDQIIILEQEPALS